MTAAKLALLLAVAWGAKSTILSAIDDLRNRDWQFSQLHVGWAVFAGFLYLASQLPMSWFWWGVLSGLGQHVTLPRALRAYYIGHLGKYIPGKAMVVVIRAGLVGRPHVKTSLAVVAVFYETFTAMAVGAVIAAFILIFSHREQPWLIVCSLALALIVGLPTLPPVFYRILGWMRLLPSTAASSETPQGALHLSAGLLLRGWIANTIGWLLAGASLLATLRAIGVGNVNLATDWPLCVATIALAVVLGFVSLLPAGVGVRDIALLQLLAPRLEILSPGRGQALALVAVIVLRLIWLLAEAILAAVLWPMREKTVVDLSKTV
ncbi:MAG TPA: lysylphosphatidylglycerol synthase domain-containing protein [Pirellulales bacterium]